MRKLNKRILILCEGVTERLYASSLRNELPRHLQRSISIEISEAEQQDPWNLVMEAVRKTKRARKEKNPYEEVWLFFDHDNSPKLKDAFGRVEEEGFQIAFTSIVWSIGLFCILRIVVGHSRMERAHWDICAGCGQPTIRRD